MTKRWRQPKEKTQVKLEMSPSPVPPWTVQYRHPNGTYVAVGADDLQPAIDAVAAALRVLVGGAK